MHFVDAQRAATACAVVRPSPVAMTMRTPGALRRRQRLRRVVALIGSDTASSPASWPSTARCIDARAFRAQRFGLRRQRVDTRRRVCFISAVLPSATALPATLPRTPMPVLDSKLSGLSSFSPRSRAARTIAVGQRMLAALVEAGGQAQHFVFA